MDFTDIYPYMPVLLKGSLVTLALTGVVIAIAAPIAFSVALLRRGSVGFVSGILAVLGWIFRGIPPLILLLAAYFIPTHLGWHIGSFQAAVMAMSIYMVFYYVEVFRAGLEAISIEQYQTAKSLGLTRFRTMRRIIFPQMLPIIAPPFISHSSTLLKTTALASAVAVPELTGAARNLFSVTFRPLEVLLVAALIYGIMSAALFYLQYEVEKRYGRSHVA